MLDVSAVNIDLIRRWVSDISRASSLLGHQYKTHMPGALAAGDLEEESFW